MNDRTLNRLSEDKNDLKRGIEDNLPTNAEFRVSSRIAMLVQQKTLMKEYLMVKLNEEDWHGVQDAGSDLRDIESELKGLKYGYEK